MTATDSDMVVVEEERTDCFRLILILILISEFSSISRVLDMTQARKHSPMSVLPNLELESTHCIIALARDRGSGCSYFKLPHALPFPLLISGSRFLQPTFAAMPYFSPDTRDSPQFNDRERANEDTTKNSDFKRAELEAPAETAIDTTITGQQPLKVDVVLTNTLNTNKPAECDATPEDDKEKESRSSGDSSLSDEKRRTAMKKMSLIRFIWPTSCMKKITKNASIRVKLDPEMDDETQELVSYFKKHVQPAYQG